MKVLHGLDVVVGEAEPSEQVDVLQPFDGDQVVGGEVKNLVWIESNKQKQITWKTHAFKTTKEMQNATTDI